MKKAIFFGVFAGILGICANASADGFAYTETETVNTYETIQIDTVTYVDATYVAPRVARATVRAEKPAPCRVASSLDVARKPCGYNAPASKKMQPVRVKTYTEVIDHYQVYQPVVTYKPAGEYTTRRYIDAPNPKFGTCAR